MILLLLLVLFATDGTARCDAARREATKAAEAAWMQAAEQGRREAEARVEAAKEAMYRVRDACGEGPIRPVRTSHLGRSVVHEPESPVYPGGLADGR